ncbi:SET and MYND domain-containing protein 4-like [Contarinia nasturtii]|uniref:SET and MYND domain-containing protein 4-like n=1 Tax=Contarinia nasturtii TaxID=265458 RepID=UPI0012D39DA1|nr:SET and MYND domain-containing protein 4-like [Contarinia nasturtii]
MQEINGSQWDIMMNVLIDSGKYLDKNAYAFSDEMGTVDFLNQNPDVSKILRRWIVKLNETRPRSTDLTNRLRQGGNQYFAEITEPFDVAADYYTKAIFSAPKNSVELGMAHANRAACFLRILDFMEEGYYDCELALKYNYPINKRDKLLDRKFYLAKDVAKCEETIHEMEELIEKKIFTEKQMKLSLRRKQLEEMRNRPNESSETTKNVENYKQMIIKTGESVGRYVVAGEDIKKEEIIFREKAFAFVPVYNDYHPDTILYHCQNCAKTNCIPFPCNECVRATYCSPLCVERHKAIHKYECVGYQKNLWMKIGIAHLSFRNFLVGFADAIERLDEIESTPMQVFEKLSSINEPDFVYGDVLRLVTNFDKMDINDCLRYALTAELLAAYLDECTDFYTNLPAKCSKILATTEWKKITAALLMRHMGQLVCNGHAIGDFELMPPSHCDYSYRDTGTIMVSDIHLVVSFNRVFTAICPTVSMLNHSCKQNVYNKFDGEYLSIYARYNIAKGAEILNCYGPNFKLFSKLERQALLKQQYSFDCKCEKCLSDDQTFMKFYEYICPNENCRAAISIDVDHQWWYNLDDHHLMSQIAGKFHCKKCKKIFLLNPRSLREFYEMTNTENDLEFQFYRKRRKTEAAISYYMTVSKCLSKYHELKTFMAKAILSYQMNADQKELFNSLAYIAMDNYVITREKFGPYSLELIMASTYALNILKMAKVIEQDKKSQNQLAEIRKIRKVLDIRKMYKSFALLSKQMQIVFKNAIKEIDETPQLDELTSKLNLNNDDEIYSEDSDSID